jgi:hypothetical protein
MLTFAGTLLCESGVFIFRRFALSFAMQHGADYGQISTMVDGKEVVTNTFGFQRFCRSNQKYNGRRSVSCVVSESFSNGISVIFIIGLISALFPSADGALTAVTSSYCVDLLNLNEDQKKTRNKRNV